MILKLLNSKAKANVIKMISVMVCGAVLTACTATKGVDSSPILRKFQWASFLEGGDFKNTCKAGSPNRYRMIYNAIYTEQVRIYELNQGSMALHSRIVFHLSPSDFIVDDIQNIWKRWQGQTIDTRVSGSDLKSLVQDLKTADVFGTPNVGLELSSKGFYWTVAACHQGKYHFTAFTWPSDEWKKLRFDGRLFALDATGVPINLPRTTDTKRSYSRAIKDRMTNAPAFHLKVGKNGLANFAPLF